VIDEFTFTHLSFTFEFAIHLGKGRVVKVN
jgi:hypothetical protein